MKSRTSRTTWRPGIVVLGLMMALVGSGLGVARAQEGPMVIKTRVFINVYQIGQTWMPAQKKYLDKATSWMPSMRFSVAGPLASGSQLTVEFTKANGAPWWKFDIPTEEVKEGDWTNVSTPRRSSNADEKKYINSVGAFGFKIRLSNELTSQNQVLMSGKYKVSKIPKGRGFKGRQNICDYVVDQDWRLPLGTLWYRENSLLPHFIASMWFKGEINETSLAGYLFYNGKQIGSTKDQGSAGTVEEQFNTNTNDKGDPTWKYCEFEWNNVLTTKGELDDNPNLHYLDKNPGQYEIKVLRNGKLSRQATFTVGEDGKIVDPGIVAANKLGTDRILIPVKVLGTLDGAWNKLAWKTGAFYGNPLKGFTAP